MKRVSDTPKRHRWPRHANQGGRIECEYDDRCLDCGLLKRASGSRPACTPAAPPEVRAHAPEPGQGSLFAQPAEPDPVRHAMDPQIPMANHTYQRRSAHPTSAAAAVKALPRSGTQRARVLEVIHQAGPAGLTDQEIATKLALAENSVRPRRLELSDPSGKGMPRPIVDSGQRRQTSAGKQAIAWVALEHAEGVARGA